MLSLQAAPVEGCIQVRRCRDLPPEPAKSPHWLPSSDAVDRAACPRHRSPAPCPSPKQGRRASRWHAGSAPGLGCSSPASCPDDLGRCGRPRSGEPAWLRQANSIWQSAADILRAGGADVSRIVRCDQFFADWRAVPFFHQARRNACGSYIAPSTSILQPEMLVPGAAMMTDMIAVAADGPAIEPIFPDGLDIPSTSAFVPVVKAGHLVFVAGIPGGARTGRSGRHRAGGQGARRASVERQPHRARGEISDPREARPGAGRRRPRRRRRGQGQRVPVGHRRRAGVQSGLGRNLSRASFRQRRSFPPASPALRSPTRAWRSIWCADRRRAGSCAIESGRAADAVCDGHPVAVRAGDILLFSGTGGRRSHTG